MRFAERRAEFGRRMGGDAVALLFTAPAVTRNGDVEHDYRFDSDFWYLTGFAEPEAVAVLRPDRADAAFVLFVRPRDPAQETWTGRRTGVEGACRDFGATVAHPIAELAARLPGYLENASRLYYAVGRDEPRDRLVHAALADVRRRIRTGVRAPHTIVEPGTLLHEMRLRKDADEVAALRRAGALSAAAHVAAMREARPGMHEYEVQALVDAAFRRGGAPRNGYPSIVGAGPNATVLHYTENRRPIARGDLLLIDAGAEIDGYSADITRTFPAGGRFSPAQRAIYEVVLAAQTAACAAVRPGVPFLRVHETAQRVLIEGMLRLGLVRGTLESVLKDESYRRWFMHRTSHWLGLDVHDVGAYRVDGQWRPLEPGMVLTVEPGLYVAADAADAPPEYRGIGVRIEDDLLVTPEGHEVLTAGVPKTVPEIEALTTGGSTSLTAGAR